MSSDKSGRLWQSSMPAVQNTHLETQTPPWVCPGRWELTMSKNVSSFCTPTDHLCSACCQILLFTCATDQGNSISVNRGKASKWCHRKCPENMFNPIQELSWSTWYVQSRASEIGLFISKLKHLNNSDITNPMHNRILLPCWHYLFI